MRMLGGFQRFIAHCAAGTLGILGLTGCFLSKLAADDYFSGAYLEAAQAIVVDDMAQLGEAVKRLDDIDAPGEKGMTLLWFALYRENFDAVETLVALGSQPGEQIAEGIGSALGAALMHKDPRYLKAMLDGGLDPNRKSKGGTPLINEAAGPAGHTLEHVKLLLAYGADINARTSRDITPLQEAIDTHRPDV